ncbi:MAG: UvrD-helicase domain-containing protein [Lachnospiraceae bacterium]|nr:UvrD-helicase domain-containing protein [Lachnospiraceae bacterium]
MDGFELLNDRQREAVTTTEGPLLVLAGAGSGKTRVLTYRVAYLLEQGLAEPFEVMAITFTNKAADEMKERIRNLVEFGEAVWVATFHSTCVRILRRDIDRLGYETNFTIYDADDQRTAMRHIMKSMGYDPKKVKERKIVARISAYKNEGITADDLYLEGETNPVKKEEAILFEAYQKYLRANNALDFDDLLLKTVELFETCPDVLERYQHRFRYVLVDEYQDTNPVQFRFVHLLAMKHRNLMVVGDDDQSIYRFRGADIRNILEFEKYFPGTKVVKLEQNYRSTTHILDVANASISHNKGRKEKRLWSSLGPGSSVTFRQYYTAKEEAADIIGKIVRETRSGARKYSDYAILYRTNAQSRLFEEACLYENVPYQIVGGINFYQRAEVKDVIAYLKVIDSGFDDLSAERALKVPKRGIGDSTIARLLSYAGSNGKSLMESIEESGRVPGVDRARGKLSEFAALIRSFREDAKEMPIDELIRTILEKTAYFDEVLDEFEEEKRDEKQENIEELISKAADYELNHDEEEVPTLSGFLQNLSLVGDADNIETGTNRILLITIHGAKGLEFPTVFLTGLEDGIFPSYMSTSDEDVMSLEEERRLFYVGVTRAMKQLCLSAAKSRMTNGETIWNPVSRFVNEVPENLLETNSRSFGTDFGSFGSYQKPKQPSPVPHPSFGKAFTVVKSDSLDYTVGDRVRHVRFGEGTVLAIDDGKKDFEVTVRFDAVGEKRLLAGFAKLEKI